MLPSPVYPPAHTAPHALELLTTTLFSPAFAICTLLQLRLLLLLPVLLLVDGESHD